MGYSDIFKERRKTAQMTQEEVAKKLSCSINLVSFNERPFKKTKQLPSENYIKKFVSLFAATPQDKKDLERRLMIERALIQLPHIVAEQFRECLTDRGIVNSGSMSVAFRKMVAADWKNAGAEVIVGFDTAAMKAIIAGNRLLSRDEVISLARALNKDPEDYLFAAEFITIAMLSLIRRFNFEPKLVERISALPQEYLDTLIDVFLFTVTRYEKNTLKHKTKKT